MLRDRNGLANGDVSLATAAAAPNGLNGLDGLNGLNGLEAIPLGRKDPMPPPAREVGEAKGGAARGEAVKGELPPPSWPPWPPWLS